MDSDHHIEVLYRLINDDQYSEADQLLGRLRAGGKCDVELLLCEAICRYEDGDDVECLKLLANFVTAAPEHIKTDYATFMAATCLANLGLFGRALRLLQMVSPSYPKRDEEMRGLRARLDSGRKAEEFAQTLEDALGHA
ncbi:MAG: hypothetical protein JO295_04400 [Verrucomicrobia bacterium]|nr:hypothetical protein [Verrucomicrobiota bacterium]